MRTLSASSAAFARATFIIFMFFSALALAGQAHANNKYAGIVIDAKTGKTLYSYNADSLRYPASLTKMMTMYMMFEAIEDGRMKKSTRIRVSKYAASKPPSKIGIRAGRTIRADHAILALATKSANDVAAAVAEHLGGTEANFGKMMTAKARQLGMSKTTFRNASGLTARGQLSTARDMARLGIALREHFPQHYKYFSTRTFNYGKARYRNHNRLLGQVRGVDGIKTGYTRASGFNLVSSVQTNRRSIVAVVMGGRSGKSRNAQMRKLINKYLPRASRGKKRTLIASRKSSRFVVAAANIELPKTGPMPSFRERVVARKEIEPKPIQVAAVAVPAKSATKLDKVTVMERLAQADTPVPAVRPSAPVGGATHQLSYVEDTVTASVDSPVKPSGWVVQIAATDSKQSAINMLEAVRNKVPGVLRNKSIYTEPVNKGDTVLHRARFAGFADKSAAWDACEALKRKKVSCYALVSG